jgi:two-component system sensor histidine kinase QseC
LIFDATSREASVDGVPLPVSRRESALLEEFLRAAGRVVIKDVLAESLIEERYETFLAFVPFVLTSLVLLWFISDRSMRPLERASREASAIGPSDPSARIDDRGLPTEIRPLVDAMNGALSRLASALIFERRLTADAAHELRTPLAVLSLRLQKAKSSGDLDWRAIEGDVAQMTRLVGQLLNLARKESSSEVRDTTLSPVNLSRVAREAAAFILPLVEEAGRRIEVDAAGAVHVLGQADDLRDMACNLLENALVHGSGTIRVEVRKTPSQGGAETAVVEVSDEGEGVPEALRDEVFERFQKGCQTSPGAGIGLAIVRQVVCSHGGDLRFLAGRGCRVAVALPVLANP